MIAQLVSLDAGSLTPAYSLADFKAQAGVGLSTRDAVLTRLLGEYQAVAEESANRLLVVRDVTELWYLCAPLGGFPPFPMVPDVQSVTEISYGDTPAAGTAVDRLDYSQAGDRILLNTGKAWPWSVPTFVRLTYKAGLVQGASDVASNAAATLILGAVYTGVQQYDQTPDRTKARAVTQKLCRAAKLPVRDTVY